MRATNIENIVVDEANHRTYVILAPKVLTDGEIYRAIRQELLRRGGKALPYGETLTLTVTSSGRSILSLSERDPLPNPAVPTFNEEVTAPLLHLDRRPPI